MQVTGNQWHAKVYLWWYRRRYHTTMYDNGTGSVKQSNLCPYMRVVLFWAPLYALFSTWVKLLTWENEDGDTRYISLNMLTIPLTTILLPFGAGYLSYDLKMFLWILELAVLAIAVTVIAVAFTYVGVRSYKASYRKKHYGDPPSKLAESGAKFWSLLTAYFRAGHDRICPEITIKALQKEEQMPSSTK